MTTQNYLRGTQESNANGKVRFTTIYPGCYSGRWPHTGSLDGGMTAALTVAVESLSLAGDEEVRRVMSIDDLLLLVS